jgi:hypothetical protein
MYESSLIYTKPANSQLLWRYMTPDRLIDLLESKELFFTHLPAFEDKLEGALTKRSRNNLSNWYRNQGSSPENAHEDVKLYETHHEAFYANCWHMNDVESYLMWRAYADRGYAVRTTFERVQDSFEPFAGSITGGVVNYVDFEHDITALGNVFHQVITKDMPYRDEREFRLVFWRHDLKNQAIQPGPEGLRVAIDVSLLIERVFVSPSETNIPDNLLALMKQHDIPYDSSQVSLR